uniref:UDP-glucosyltransferase UGT83P1 n=1 Tax=Polygala tenuifolia TaxID=355332 RepID=A0A3G3NBE6_9FABA|nr:UDP-glucosyltransferase UGT83P1 [Polygala tenuifolia]
MSSPHVLVIPYPVQGHVIPLMSLSQKLVKHGIKVTFVNTDACHKRVVSAISDQDGLVGPNINLVSIPDGLEHEDDRNKLGKLCSVMLETMPTKLEKLIEDISTVDVDNRITCVLADGCMGWTLEVAQKLGIKGALLWPASVTVFAVISNIPKMIDEGILDNNGYSKGRQTFQLSPTMPEIDTVVIPWSSMGDTTSQNLVFEYFIRIIQTQNLAEWTICNTVYEFEPEALALCTRVLPVGPLMETCQDRTSRGQFWEDDYSCLDWLDQQPTKSVIYVAFGSLAVLNQIQFQELALGLELTGQPFLWVVRADDDSGTNTKYPYPDEFQGTRGKIIGWAPQQKILSHPAIACFISHCGWNSTLEGLSNGVPFLCWPYFADQFINKTYICDEWKVGLGFDFNDERIITRTEIKKKVDQLLSNEETRARSLKLKEIARNNMVEGGQSYENLNNFINWLMQQRVCT